MIFIEETDLRYEIKESLIPNAGYGLFAKEHIKKGDWLEVIGVYVKTEGVSDHCTHYAKRYKFAGGPKFNAKIIPMGYGAIVNHSDDPKIMNCHIEYVPGLNKRSPDAGQIVYRFLRDVLPGEEIVGNYGANVGPEIHKLSKNLGYFHEEIDEWDRFLEFDLYGLKKIFKNQSFP